MPKQDIRAQFTANPSNCHVRIRVSSENGKHRKRVDVTRPEKACVSTFKKAAVNDSREVVDTYMQGEDFVLYLN